MNFDKDIAALESLFTKETYNYHNSASLQGKPWYGIALEDNDSNTQKDDANKKGIVKRMIDAIKAFIKRVVDKIKSFFSGKDKNKVKEDEAFVKAYKGPTEAAAVNAFADYASNLEKDRSDASARMEERWKKEDAEKASRDAARFDLEQKQQARKANDQKLFEKVAQAVAKDLENQKKINKILGSIFDATGKIMPVEEVKEKIEESMVKKIQTKLTAHRMSMLLAMLGRTYHTVFTELLHTGDEISHTSSSTIDLDMLNADLVKAEDMSKLLQACYSETNEASTIEEKEEIELLEALIAGDSEIAARSNLYFQQTYNSVMSTTLYLEQLGKMQDSVYAGNDGMDNGVTRRIQKLVRVLAEYLGWISRVSGIATAVSDILRGN